MTGVGRLASIADRREVREAVHKVIHEGRPWDHLILGVSGYPDITMEQTRFAVECCRELSPRRMQSRT